ncbi:MAG: UDP-N-acetylmuramoyl-tripeptide--D-alanyl-D-alanine ligase [Chloroflexota bacterium]|nr:UDP-N-acetylmuramoyl-tripeptide--D-alanyl-D-alanine ligase [Chloroflexota bacterium]
MARPDILLNDILTATGTRVVGDLPSGTAFRWIERDSRSVQPGDLFIAVRGERFDGHQFVAPALDAGATAALVAEDWFGAQGGGAPGPLLVVPDPVVALQQIAAARRQALDVTVVGITGSIGKTSTKEVVAAVLGQRYRTYRNPGNLNSEIGLPLCLLEMDAGTEAAVLEMGGAYAFGELALLADIAQPRIGIVTNVHPVHLERMGTIENIAKTKAELIEALPKDGFAILNGDDPRVMAMSELAPCEVLTYGLSPTNDIWASDFQTHGLRGSTFRLHLEGEIFHVRVPLVGGHAAYLALPALAAGYALGLHVSDMLPGFDDPEIQVRLLVLDGPNGSLMIDDTYNASGPSVLSALGLLDDVAEGRRIAVLGDMRELGEESEAHHRMVGRKAAEVVDDLVTFGPLALTIAEEARATVADVGGRLRNVRSFGLDERDEMVAFLRTEPREGDVMLLKGSRGLEMESIVAALKPMPQ